MESKSQSDRIRDVIFYFLLLFLTTTGLRKKNSFRFQFVTKVDGWVLNKGLCYERKQGT